MSTPGPKRTRPYYPTIMRYQTKSTQGVLQELFLSPFWDLAPGLLLTILLDAERVWSLTTNSECKPTVSIHIKSFLVFLSSIFCRKREIEALCQDLSGIFFNSYFLLRQLVLLFIMLYVKLYFYSVWQCEARIIP